MNAVRTVLTAMTGLVGTACLMVGSAAFADVKAGVDAWSAGDYAKAVSEWRGPADKGDPDAMFNLAQAYRLGRGVPEDIKQAETYYARAAAKGHIKAADNYGLLLFQDGRREQALPYVVAAAERGDPRAQYLVGIAHFNGDLVAKDWVRAYALLTLANGAGLPQAAQVIRQMDGTIPLAQRQQAQTLASTMRARADSVRSSQLAAADLGVVTGEPPVVKAAPTVADATPTRRVPQAVVPVKVPPSASSGQSAIRAATGVQGTESPATAGADFARPAIVSAPPSVRTPAAAPNRVAQAAPPRAAPAAAIANGPWRLQLGAFSVPGNAERAWSQVAGKAALSGKVKVLQPAGKLTRLFASGWATQGAAEAACASLKAGGQACLVTR